jgi:hypothetical protein
VILCLSFDGISCTLPKIMKFYLIKQDDTRAAAHQDDANPGFGADHAHSYVNGVLDKLAAELPSAEKRG